MILIATIAGVFALIFWGLSDYFAGKSGQVKDEYLTNFIIQAVGAVLLFPIFLLFGLPISIDSSLLIVVSVALFTTIAYISFIKALSIGPFGVAAPLANSYAFITLGIGLVFLGFQATQLQFVALAIIIVGVLTLVVDRAILDRSKIRGTTVYFAGITMVSWGIGFALIELVVNSYTWLQLVFLVLFFMSLFSFFAYVGVRRRIPSWNELKYRNMEHAWQSGLLAVIGTTSFFIGAERSGSVVIPAVIASASPLTTSFMAYWQDNEKLPLYKRIGAIVIILGLMALNL